METLKLKITNYHNKTAASVFVHVFKSKGERAIFSYKEEVECIINDGPDIWLVHDIGHMPAGELPPWIYFISHGCRKDEFIKSSGITPEHEVYWFIFKKKSQ